MFPELFKYVKKIGHSIFLHVKQMAWVLADNRRTIHRKDFKLDHMT